MRSEPVRIFKTGTVLTGRQTYVLDNLDRVCDWPYKLHVRSPGRRYRLDGQDCTTQIHSLSVKGLISVTQDGAFKIAIPVRAAEIA